MTKRYYSFFLRSSPTASSGRTFRSSASGPPSVLFAGILVVLDSDSGTPPFISSNNSRSAEAANCSEYYCKPTFNIVAPGT